MTAFDCFAASFILALLTATTAARASLCDFPPTRKALGNVAVILFLASCAFLGGALALSTNGGTPI